MVRRPGLPAKLRNMNVAVQAASINAR